MNEMIKVEKGDFPYRYIVNGEACHFEYASLGKYKGKTFMVKNEDCTCIGVTDMEYEMSGFSHPVRIPLAVKLSDEKLSYQEAFLNTAKKSLYYIDGFESSFEGYSYNQTWNGWEMPMFDKETSLKIAQKCCNDEYFTHHFDKDKDTFFIQDMAYEEEDPIDLQGHDIVTEDGSTVHVYNFGDLGWCWNEQTPETENDE